MSTALKTPAEEQADQASQFQTYGYQPAALGQAFSFARPVATPSVTTPDGIAHGLEGQIYQAQYTAYVQVTETNYPFTTVSNELVWGGSPGALRGVGVAFGFANPRTVAGISTVDVFAYTRANTYNSIGPYDVLGYTGTNILLGAEPFNPGTGYGSYLLIHNTTLQPGVTDQTFPFTVGTDPAVTPITPPPATGIPPVPCYAAGTHVATARGDVAVEELKVGDLIRTASGAPEFRPIVWIGNRALQTARHPEPKQVAPIRIRAGAFSDAQPVRDLLVSPDHAVFVDGVLIPARLLVNGGSIVQELSMPSIRYFHIELDSHDVMLAEGLPAESYLAGTNRGAFFNGEAPTELHPSFGTDEEAYAGTACAPLATAAAAVLPVWSRLAARAAGIGLTPSLPAVTADSRFRVMAGTRELTATTDGDRHVFTMPRGAKTVRLVSRSASPADTRPWLDDRRRLGVMVAGIAVQTASGRADIAMDDASLTEGWWTVEASDIGAVRWTDGDAAVTLPRGAKTLEIRVVGEMSYPREEIAIAA